MTDTMTDTQRALYQAQRRVSMIDNDRLTALEDKLASIEAMFENRDGSPRTANQSIAALSHRLDMKDGEIMALWGSHERLAGGVDAIHSLLVPNRNHVAKEDKTINNGDGGGYQWNQ